jgi:predicted P-loop ATPase
MVRFLLLFEGRNGMPNELDLFQKLSLNVFFWERRGDPQTDWKRALGVNWNDKSTVWNAEDYDPKTMNVGVITGQQLAPGRFLADIDLDGDNPPMPIMNLLPASGCLFGRPGKFISHLFFSTPDQLPSVKEFYDVNGVKFMELFSGDNAQYTMVPPSLRRPNEALTWVKNDEITHVTDMDDFYSHLRDYAIAYVLHQAFGPRGFQHSQRLATAGFLLKEGLEEKFVDRIGRAVCAAGGNDAEDFSLGLKTTASHLKAGNTKVKGKRALADDLGDVGKRLISRIKQFIGNDDFIRDEKGKVIPTVVENIRIALDKLDVNLSFDKFSNKMYIQNGRGPQLFDDPTWIPLWIKVDENYRFRPSEHLFLHVLRDAAWKNPYHPVKDYLSKLTWDGVSRIDDWLVRYGRAENTNLTRSIAAKVLLAAVRRVRQPGCKFDEMLILESEQGKTKSSAILALCPDARWFSDDLPLGAESREVIEATGGKWIIEAAELQNIRGKEVERLKAFLSRQTDGPVRMAYDRTPTEVPRQFIIIGTTNLFTGYLRDSTGNRRFWPVRVQEFDVPGLARDRDQLWAEASHREALGESIRLEEDLWRDASVQQEKRAIVDEWEELIFDGLDDDVDWIPTNIVWEKLGVRANMRDPRASTRVYEIMQRHGFVEKQKLSVTFVVDGNSGRAKQMTCWVKQYHSEGKTVRWVSEFADAYAGRPEKEENDGKFLEM